MTNPWMTLPGASDIPNCALQMHRSFVCEEPLALPPLRISAESRFLLYVNGSFVCRGPIRGTFGVHYVEEANISSWLRRGENHIAVCVHSQNSTKNFNTHPSGCALMAELPGVFSGAAGWRGRLMPGWHNTTQHFTFQHGAKIELDLREGGWDTQWMLGEGTADWQEAIPFSSPLLDAKRILPRDIPPLQETRVTPRLLKYASVQMEAPATLEDGTTEDIAELLNREIWEDNPNALTPLPEENAYRVSGEATALVFDFGKPVIGYFSLEVDSPEDGIRVEFTYGETLWNGRVRASYLKAGGSPTYLFTDSYILKKGSNTICNPFEMHGATMVQVEIRGLKPRESATLRDFHCLDCRYPFTPDAHFCCSDPLLERIWEISCETMRACTADTFMDCPWREHAFWVNDLIIENRASLAMFGSSAIHRHSFEMAFSQQYESGWIPAVAPTPVNEKRPPNILPATNLFLFWMLEDYLRESGDRETIRKYLPNLRKVLAAFENTVDESGLVESPEFAWDVWDWAFELNANMFIHSRESMLNSLYISAMKCFQRLCQECGDSCPEKPILEERIERTAKAMRRFIVTDEATGKSLLEDIVCRVDLVTDAKTPEPIRSELAQALAISSGVWSDAEKKDFLEGLLGHTLREPELYLSGLVFQALHSEGKDQEVLDRIRKHWGNVVKHGCTTLPECGVYRFGREGFKESGSLCHGFATTPAVFFKEIILGIQAMRPGYEEFTFAPHPLDLAYASGTVRTPKGCIEARWEKQADGIHASLVVPPGMTAVLPDGRRLASGCHDFIF